MKLKKLLKLLDPAEPVQLLGETGESGMITDVSDIYHEYPWFLKCRVVKLECNEGYNMIQILVDWKNQK